MVSDYIIKKSGSNKLLSFVIPFRNKVEMAFTNGRVLYTSSFSLARSSVYWEIFRGDLSGDAIGRMPLR